jgi:DNA-binding GntR family transcriptional regulator
MLGWLTEYHVGLLRKLGQEAQTLSEHRHILDRIADHDVDGSAAAMLATIYTAPTTFTAARRREVESARA